MDGPRKQLRSLDAIAKLIGRHYITVLRWQAHGIRGVKLKVFPLGATLRTNLEEVDKFSELVVATKRRLRERRHVKMRTPLQARRAHERAERRLDEMGVK